MLAAILIIVISFILPEEWIELPLAIGGILGVVLILIGARIGLKRFFFLGALAIVLGILAVIYFDEVLGSAYTFLGVGLAEIVSGGFALAKYIRSHPEQREV
jgi:hypothetical protein